MSSVNNISSDQQSTIDEITNLVENDLADVVTPEQQKDLDAQNLSPSEITNNLDETSGGDKTETQFSVEAFNGQARVAMEMLDNDNDGYVDEEELSGMGDDIASALGNLAILLRGLGEQDTNNQIDEAVDDTSEAVDDTSEAVDDTSEAVDDTSEAVDDTSEAVDDTSEAVDDTSEAVDDTSEAVDDTSEAADDTSEAVDDTGEAADDTSEAVEITPIGADEAIEGLEALEDKLDTAREFFFDPDSGNSSAVKIIDDIKEKIQDLIADLQAGSDSEDAVEDLGDAA